MRNSTCEIHKAVFWTPLGWSGVCVSDRGICRVILPKKDKTTVENELNHAECGPPLSPARVLKWRASKRTSLSAGNRLPGILKKTVKLLQRYFSGKSVSFDLPLDMRYYTDFQQAVWKSAVEIPFGETRSYAWIAQRIKNPKAARAVGQAMGANPIPIIIP